MLSGGAPATTLSYLDRRHSRSTSQLATLAALTLTSSPTPPSPSSHRVVTAVVNDAGESGTRSPQYSVDGLINLEDARGGNSRSSSRRTSPERRTSVERERQGSLGRRRSIPQFISDTIPLPTLLDSPIISSESSSPPNLAHLIQQKRRQASAPYFTAARSSSLFSPGSGFSISATTPSLAKSTDSNLSASAVSIDDARRVRSRRASRVATPAVQSLRIPDSSTIAGLVMTPTTEEWRALGGRLTELADIRARDEALLLEGLDHPIRLPLSTATSFSSSSTSSSSIELSGPRLSESISPFNLPTASTSSISLDRCIPLSDHTETIPIPVIQSSFSYQSSHSGFSHSRASSLTFENVRTAPSPTSTPLPSQAIFKPTHRLQQSNPSLRPNLSRGSLASNSSTPGGTVYVDEPAVPTIAIHLDTTLGPVDPRQYSAVTGLRTIDSFVIEGDVGKGAYGTVKRARERAPTGEPIGPELIIKCVIKQRILADCWKKHKILGPIPIEVHVLDHLRRVPYVSRANSRSEISHRFSDLDKRRGVTLTGHPNICGLLDFFEDGEFYYLVMPRAGPDFDATTGGQDLFDLVDLHPDGLALPSISRIFSQLADAICFLHHHGIVHRDIKDENIILDHEGNVQVIDFGSAAYVKEGRKFDTFSGTLDFAAPEVLKGERYGGKESDIWALGVLGYVTVCGECPFWSPEEAIMGLYPGSRAEQALRSKLTEDQDDSVPRDENGIGSMAEVIDIVMRCLEIDPKNRPTAMEVVEHRFIIGSNGWIGYRGWD